MNAANMPREWMYGARAFCEGESQSKNPYDRGSSDWENWRDGWRFARSFHFMTNLHKAYTSE